MMKEVKKVLYLEDRIGEYIELISFIKNNSTASVIDFRDASDSTTFNEDYKSIMDKFKSYLRDSNTGLKGIFDDFEDVDLFIIDLQLVRSLQDEGNVDTFNKTIHLANHVNDSKVIFISSVAGSSFDFKDTGNATFIGKGQDANQTFINIRSKIKENWGYIFNESSENSNQDYVENSNQENVNLKKKHWSELALELVRTITNKKNI